MPGVTRNDVARRAGTSSAVVSYVFNNGPRPVAEATRDRVLRAAAELGYRPSPLARGLRTSRTSLMGLLVPDATMPYFAAVGQAVEQAAFAHEHLTLIGNAAGSPQQQERYLRAFLDLNVAGLVLVDVGPTSGIIELLAGHEHRVVQLHRRVRGLGAMAVLADDERGGRIAGQHLVEHGHRRIACLTGNDRRAPVADRYRGWAKAMAAAGLPADLVGYSSYRPADARTAARRLLSSRPAPAAVFAATDELAHATLDAARDQGLRVPEELAVIGMDGLPHSALSSPPLTTVHIPLRDLARTAVDSLLVTHPPATTTPAVRRLPVRLDIRRSCGCTP